VAELGSTLLEMQDIRYYDDLMDISVALLAGFYHYSVFFSRVD
jgi:hypothetical protein